LPWITEIWIENHLASDNNCKTINLQSPPKRNLIKNKNKIVQGMTNKVGLNFSVGDPILKFKISIKQDNENRRH
jgi:hypothetical protein